MMTTDDMLKLKAVTLYILKQCGELDFIHLFKIYILRSANIMLLTGSIW